MEAHHFMFAYFVFAYFVTLFLTNPGYTMCNIYIIELYSLHIADYGPHQLDSHLERKALYKKCKYGGTCKTPLT
jgi:hypothetical protein